MGAFATAMPFASGLAGRARAAAPEELELIVPFSPGGGTDRSLRAVGPAWSGAMDLSSPLEYTYAPGAGTVIATNQLLNGPKDGTVVQGIPIPYTAWTIALEQGNYALEDLAWIGGYFDDPDILLVPNDSPYDSIAEFIEDAKREEKTVAVSAPMSASHAATVVLRESTGAKLRIVPFDGGSESRNAVAGGHTDACLAPYWSATHVLDLTKAIGIFSDSNPAPDLWQPEPVNEALGLDLPNLVEPYALQMAAEAADQNPDTYETFVTALEEAATSEALATTAEELSSLDLFLTYRSPEACSTFLSDYLSLLEEYRPAMQRDLDQL